VSENSLIYDDFTNQVFGTVSYFRVNVRSMLDNKIIISTIKNFLSLNSVSWELIEIGDSHGDWFVRFIGPSLQEVFRTLPQVNTVIDAAWINFYSLDPVSVDKKLPLLNGDGLDSTYILLITPKGELFTMPSDFMWMKPYTFTSSGHFGSSGGSYSMASWLTGTSSVYNSNKTKLWLEEKKKKNQLRSKIIAQTNKKAFIKGGFKNSRRK